MAEILGITAATVSRYVNLKISPPEEAIYAAASYFNVSSDYLLGLTDNIHGDISED